MDRDGGQQRPIIEIINRFKTAVEDLERATDVLREKCGIYMVREQAIAREYPSPTDAESRYNIPVLDELEKLIRRINCVKDDIKEISTLLA